jgi:hypothetical protein
MCQVRYRDSYFEERNMLDGYAAGEVCAFVQDLTEQLKKDVAQQDENSVEALLGVGALFGVARVSSVVNGVAPAVRGRLLVFFPGEHERATSTHRLLDARDGWNYLAVPIRG